MNGENIKGVKITIPWKVFDALLSDANWKTEVINLNCIRVYHRFYGDDYHGDLDGDVL